MYSFIFGLFSLAFLLLYGMFQTFFIVKRMKQDIEQKESLKKYATKLGFLGCLSFVLATVLYNIGVS